MDKNLTQMRKDLAELKRTLKEEDSSNWQFRTLNEGWRQNLKRITRWDANFIIHPPSLMALHGVSGSQWVIGHSSDWPHSIVATSSLGKLKSAEPKDLALQLIEKTRGARA